jgi:RecB family endonuclease NucS
MKDLKLWEISTDEKGEPTVYSVASVNQTKTEEQLEEMIVQYPDLLFDDLKLVGRQTETAGGPLDLLGVDADGGLVVFELKRGTLTREAVSQIIDYASYLAELEPDDLSKHIS